MPGSRSKLGMSSRLGNDRWRISWVHERRRVIRRCAKERQRSALRDCKRLRGDTDLVSPNAPPGGHRNERARAQHCAPCLPPWLGRTAQAMAGMDGSTPLPWRGKTPPQRCGAPALRRPSVPPASNIETVGTRSSRYAMSNQLARCPLALSGQWPGLTRRRRAAIALRRHAKLSCAGERTLGRRRIRPAPRGADWPMPRCLAQRRAALPSRSLGHVPGARRDLPAPAPSARPVRGRGRSPGP